MKTALYLRVSTTPDRQHTENQGDPLRDWCKQSGFEIVEVYEDHESGASETRPAFLRMMEDARRRKFSHLVVWSLDRFTREGIARTFQHITALEQYGVKFHSFTEPIMSTGDPFAGPLFIALAAWIADYERRRHNERIAAGLARARREGIKLGRRPTLSEDQKTAARQLRGAGNSLQTIAAAIGSSKATVRRALQE